MSHLSRVVRIGFLMAVAAGSMYWTAHHAEVSFADGLRYIREAQIIERGDYALGLLDAVDHPIHPLLIAAAHHWINPDPGPYAWQTAAQAVAAIALVLAVVPLYLLGRDLFEDETTATLGCLLVFGNPVLAYVGVNVLSESSFLLFWLFGLWASVRFLREGRFGWLPPAIGFGALAYLTRPEGMLLHVSLVATLLLLPLHRLTRINWPRWRAAVALLVLGPALLVGPYVAWKGGLGTKPAVARVLGTMPEAPPAALERERPRPPDQTVVQTYWIASSRALRALRGVVTWPFVPLAVLGLIVVARDAARVRIWLFLGVLVLISLGGLVRLHATGGYCTVRHALVPGLVFLLAAAHGFGWIMKHAAIDARRLGMGEGRLRPGLAIWAAALALMLVWPAYHAGTPFNSSFAPYRMAGTWLQEREHPDDGRVLDLTDWSLYFANHPGFGIARVEEAAARPDTRFVIVRDAHLNGHGRSSEIARAFVGERAPIARFPEHPGPRQIQVAIYDLTTPPHPSPVARGASSAARQ